MLATISLQNDRNSAKYIKLVSTSQSYNLHAHQLIPKSSQGFFCGVDRVVIVEDWIMDVNDVNDVNTYVGICEYKCG